MLIEYYVSCSNYNVMNVQEIIKEIRKLPVRKRMYVIEKTIGLMRREENEIQLNHASDVLSDEFRTNKDLTRFTDIDFDDFYEAR